MLTLNLSLLNRKQSLCKCSEGLGFSQCCMESPCNPFVDDYTEV
jgi:hypothetical protein